MSRARNSARIETAVTTDAQHICAARGQTLVEDRGKYRCTIRDWPSSEASRLR